jgi:hypothetical protein
MSKSTHKDQRGIGHLLLIAVIVVVVAIIGLVAWRVIDHNKNKSGGSVEANCMKVYKDQVLCDFAAANANLNHTPYTATINSVTTNNQTTKIVVKSDGKGDFSTTSQNGNQAYNTVSIGSTVYVQSGSDWIKYTANAPSNSNGGLVGGLKAQFSQPGTPDAQRVKYDNLGKTSCGGASCYKFQVIDPNVNGTTYMWINANTNRLIQLATKTSQGTTTYNVSYGSVTISAPSPVVPASSALTPAQQAEQQATPQY